MNADEVITASVGDIATTVLNWAIRLNLPSVASAIATREYSLMDALKELGTKAETPPSAPAGEP